jgi:hypothetical protein
MSDTSEAIRTIQQAGGRTARIHPKLQMHVNASPGHDSQIIKRDDYHALTIIQKTRKLPGGGYGKERIQYNLDDREDVLTDWSDVLDHIASRVEAGWYEDRDPADFDEEE